jgi:K+-sensing histidine kinase KdpD
MMSLHDTSQFSPPYILAVVGRHADTHAFLRDVQWIAKERAINFVIAIYERSEFSNWLTGEQPVADDIGERWEESQFTWRKAAEVNALFKGEVDTRPAAVIFGPARATRWLPGMPAGARTRIARAAAAAGISILDGFQDEASTARRGTLFGLHWRLDRSRPWYQAAALSAVAVSLAGTLVFSLTPYLPNSSLALIFLTAVIYSAASYGFAAAALAALWGLSLNSVISSRTFSAWGSADVLLLLLFLLVGAITSNLAGNLRGAAGSARRQARESRALF